MPGEPVTVTMSHLLRPEGAPSVAFGSMRFGAARVTAVRAFLGERELEFRAEPSDGRRFDGTVELPAEARDATRIPLRLVYQVRPEPRPFDGDPTVVLPMLVAAWPAPEARPETFEAIVYLPAGLALRSTFPSQVEPVPWNDPTAPSRAYRFDLPVVPALLRLETATGGAPMLTTDRAVDLATAMILALLALYGLKRMRETLA